MFQRVNIHSLKGSELFTGAPILWTDFENVSTNSVLVQLDSLDFWIRVWRPSSRDEVREHCPPATLACLRLRAVLETIYKFYRVISSILSKIWNILNSFRTIMTDSERFKQRYCAFRAIERSKLEHCLRAFPDAQPFQLVSQEHQRVVLSQCFTPGL